MCTRPGRVLGAVLVGMVASSCSGLRPDQQVLVPQWESPARTLGHPEVRYEELKSPTTAAWLGVLPGCGGFYTHRAELAVAGLLTLPLSITWEPEGAYSGAYQYNFWQFRDRMIDVGSRAAEADERDLERQLMSKEIPHEVYEVRRDRLRHCAEELKAERGQEPAAESPGAINACLDEVTASSPALAR
jgi:hypothetical protein